MNNVPVNTDNVIDSRDVIERIEELEAELEEAEEDNEFAKYENADELATLKELADGDAGTSPCWSHGEILIRDSYFEEYAQELAADCCEMPTHWPLSCIDWEQTVTELQYAYMSVEFDGIDYWIRA